jgi:colicin import membrane protein
LWIAVAVGSVALHLLVFWLIRSYYFSLLWQQQGKANIPIEFIELSSQTKSRAKPRAIAKPVASSPKQVLPKSSSRNQKLQANNLPKQVVPTDKLTTKPAPTTQDKSAIAFTKQRQREIAEQRQRELTEQRQREIAEQRQRELSEQRQRELSEQRQRELSEQRQRELSEQRQGEIAGNTNNQESSPSSSNAVGGSLIASVVGEPQQGERDRHTHPARIKPSNQPFSKGLEYIKYIEKDSGRPVEFKVVLTISETGKLEHINIADEAISAQEKSYYEEFVANQVFNGWEFEPAYDNDPNDPKPSNLILRIRIEPLP